MQRFILQENAKGFRARLDEAVDEADRRRLQVMVAAVERELALLNALEAGASQRPGRVGGEDAVAEARSAYVDEFHQTFGGSSQVAYLIDPGPGLLFVAVNPAFCAATGLLAEKVLGQPLFQLFPDNPDDAQADGTAEVYASLRMVAQQGRPHAMPVMRYDVRDEDGVFRERHWRQVNSPLHDAEGRLVLLLQIVDEVTEEMIRLEAPGLAMSINS